MIVADTNVVSEIMRSSPDGAVAGWIEQQAPRDLHTTAITLAEVRFGIERLPGGQRRDALRTAADEVFGRFGARILPFGASAAVAYATLVGERERLGRPIEGVDAQIAAICRAGGATLATRNTKDFLDTGLELVDPWDHA